MVMVGIELEVTGGQSITKEELCNILATKCQKQRFKLNHHPSLSSQAISCDNGVMPGYWGIGADLSVPDGIELRTPVLLLNRQDLYDKIQPVVKTLKDLGFKSYHRSGLHVHLSSEIVIDIGLMRQKVASDDRFVKQPFTCRYQYCSFIGNEGKHLAVRVVDARNSHVEVRVWNGSLNMRHILRAVDLSAKLYESCELNNLSAD